jgi:hypothetical protein
MDTPAEVMIPLSGVNIRVGFVPGKPNEKMILLGPITLMLPLSEEGRKAIVEGLTGVQLVAANGVTL